MAKRSGVYHTALHSGPSKEPRGVLPRRRVEGQGCIALVHDVLTGELPPEFDRCDVFYTDLPWKAGFSSFEQRAGCGGRTYQQFMAAMGKVVGRLEGRPVVLVGGVTEMRHLPQTRSEPTVLNGAAARAAVYGPLVGGIDFTDTWKIVQSLAEHYQCIGDFCCGYGRAGRVFLEASKRFVMSDYNSKCIGYIGMWLKDSGRIS